jgi:hypothetical protein
MSINLESFFPSGNLKKLLKVIDLDPENREKHIQSIQTWMVEEIHTCEERAKEYANNFIDNHPKVKEAESKVKSMESIADKMKGTQAHKLAILNLKEAKKEYNRLKGLEVSYNRTFNQYHLRKERLKKNLQVMQS